MWPVSLRNAGALVALQLRIDKESDGARRPGVHAAPDGGLRLALAAATRADSAGRTTQERTEGEGAGGKSAENEEAPVAFALQPPQ